jgi:hypothetical protein
MLSHNIRLQSWDMISYSRAKECSPPPSWPGRRKHDPVAGVVHYRGGKRREACRKSRTLSSNMEPLQTHRTRATDTSCRSATQTRLHQRKIFTSMMCLSVQPLAWHPDRRQSSGEHSRHCAYPERNYAHRRPCLVPARIAEWDFFPARIQRG